MVCLQLHKMLGVGIINNVEIVKTLGTLDVVLVRFCSVR